MKRERTKLQLSIKHPTRDLAIVCQRLGVKPVNIWKAGDERRTPKGRALGGRRAESHCSIELEGKMRDPLAKKIRTALARLKPYRRILKNLSTTGGRITFAVGWFCDRDTGETFDRQIINEMSELRIGLELFIYVPDKQALPLARRKA